MMSFRYLCALTMSSEIALVELQKKYLLDKIKKAAKIYIEEQLHAPSLDKLKQWALESNPNIKWKDIKSQVQRFRNSLPIVSQIVPDGRATSSRSQYLPKAFRSPSWVASDLGLCEFRFLGQV